MTTESSNWQHCINVHDPSLWQDDEAVHLSAFDDFDNPTTGIAFAATTPRVKTHPGGLPPVTSGEAGGGVAGLSDRGFSLISARLGGMPGDRCKDGASLLNITELSTKERRGVKFRIAIVKGSRV